MTEIYERLATVLVTKFGFSPEDVNPDVKLADIELDSLGAVEVAAVLEQELGISIDYEKFDANRTLGEISQSLQGSV
jgi:acyl carrier protein